MQSITFIEVRDYTFLDFLQDHSLGMLACVLIAACAAWIIAEHS